jgi:alkylhydroperoxidase family enzyme
MEIEMHRFVHGAAVAAMLVGGGQARAQEGPRFFTEIIPPQSYEGLMAAHGALTSEGAALEYNVVELVALAVAAQIPCDYCV